MVGFGFGVSPFERFMSVVFPLVFGGILLFIVILLAKGISEWNRNNHSPQLAVPAFVVTKRTNVSGSSDMNNGMHSSTSTFYYATFQVESGDRMEFLLSGSEYGMLAEGDSGVLRFQGTRYLGFDRRVIGGAEEDPE